MVVQELASGRPVEFADGLALADALAVSVIGITADVVEITPDARKHGSLVEYAESRHRGSVEVQIEHDCADRSVFPGTPRGNRRIDITQNELCTTAETLPECGDVHLE